MRQSQFQILNKVSNILTIKDVGPWDQYPSVTNDPESVVERLIQSGDLKEFDRLLYYDSEGNLDELLFQDGKFVSFAPYQVNGRN